MGWKLEDWIEHSIFGIGQVRDDRADRLDIEFVSSGRKTILKSTELKPAAPPYPDFKFSREKGKSQQSKVERPHRPPLDFDHLISCFNSRFSSGFGGQDFHIAERAYKEEASAVLKVELGEDALRKPTA